jgi:hypothetical protein
MSSVTNAAVLGWQTRSYGLNPTDATYFPWLKAIANNYVKYRWHSLQVRFVSTSPTTTQGEVRFGALYDHQEYINWNLIASEAARSAAIVAMNSSIVAPAYGTTLPGGAGIAWDCKQIHSRVPWLLTTGNDLLLDEATDNQRVGAFFANMNFFPFANSAFGYFVVEYDVEFTQVTYGGVAGSPTLMLAECELTPWQVIINKKRKERGLPELDCDGFPVKPKPPPAGGAEVDQDDSNLAQNAN